MKKIIIPLMLTFLALPAMAQPVYRYTPAKPAVAAPEKAPLLDTHVGIGVGARTMRTTLGAGNLSGFADSELLIEGAVRQDDWLMNIELSRFKAGVNVAGVSPTLNPAWSLEEASYHLGMARLMPWGDRGEWGPALTAFWSVSTSSNNGFPFSGTPYDYNQNRAGIGVGARGAYALTDSWMLDGAFSLYPWMLNRLDRSSDQLGIGWLGGAEIGLGASYRLTEAMRATAGYQGQYVGGSNLSDQYHRFTLGLAYDFIGR